MNKTFLMGNLTRDPEIKYAPSGTAITEFGIAVSEKFKGADQKWQERTEFVDCTLFGKSAENFCQYMAKGRKVVIEGKLRLDTWEDKQSGQKRSKLRVMVDAWHMADSKLGGGQPQAKPDGGSAPDEETPF